tara:strand:- start:1488 stop:1706 length:219 start_codon:yes stop_codon:yes gene_type:complete
MEKLNDLMNEHDLDFNDIVNIIEKNIHRKIKKKQYNTKYQQTEKGKEQNKLANKKYYYKKNNIFHKIYNPNI